MLPLGYPNNNVNLLELALITPYAEKNQKKKPFYTELALRMLKGITNNVYSEEGKIKDFLYYLFENYPPLAENRLIKSFRSTCPDIKIENVKTYMDALLFKKSLIP